MRDHAMVGRIETDIHGIAHALGQMTGMLQGAGAFDVFEQKDDTNLLYGTARMGSSPKDRVVDSDHRCWDVPNLFICDGPVFPICGVNPALTIYALGLRLADRLDAMAKCRDL